MLPECPPAICHASDTPMDGVMYHISTSSDSALTSDFTLEFIPSVSDILRPFLTFSFSVLCTFPTCHFRQQPFSPILHLRNFCFTTFPLSQIFPTLHSFDTSPTPSFSNMISIRPRNSPSLVILHIRTSRVRS